MPEDMKIDKLTGLDRLRLYIHDPETFALSYEDAAAVLEEIEAAPTPPVGVREEVVEAATEAALKVMPVAFHGEIGVGEFDRMIRAALSAASVIAPVDGVRVKPLEWTELASPREDGPSEPTGDWEASSMIGAYYVHLFEDHYEVTDPHGEYVEHWCGDASEANAAAQAHFDAAIRSALVASPPSDRAGVIEATQRLINAADDVLRGLNPGQSLAPAGATLTNFLEMASKEAKAAIRSLPSGEGK